MRLEIHGVESLSWRERQVVALKETGWGTEQIAGRLGLAPATVTTLLNRARRKGYRVVLVLEGDPLALGQDEPDAEAGDKQPTGAEG